MRHFFRNDFEHAGQIKLCAAHLNLMRRTLGPAWKQVAQKEVWTREQIDLASHLIRHASESRNHLATVDFVSRHAGRYIQKTFDARSSRSRGGYAHLEHQNLTHEHMVPGKAALEILSSRGTSLQSLTSLLTGMSLRAIITKPQRDTLDKKVKLKSCLPHPRQISGWKGADDLSKIPVQFLGLMRYDAAGLIKHLEPVTDRAEEWLTDYWAYKSGR